MATAVPGTFSYGGIPPDLLNDQQRSRFDKLLAVLPILGGKYDAILEGLACLLNETSSELLDIDDSDGHVRILNGHAGMTSLIDDFLQSPNHESLECCLEQLPKLFKETPFFDRSSVFLGRICRLKPEKHSRTEEDELNFKFLKKSAKIARLERYNPDIKVSNKFNNLNLNTEEMEIDTVSSPINNVISTPVNDPKPATDRPEPFYIRQTN